MDKLTLVTKRYLIAYNQNSETARSSLHTLFFFSHEKAESLMPEILSYALFTVKILQNSQVKIEI